MYGMTVSSVASNSLTVTMLFPKSVDSNSLRDTSMSHALSLRLEFLRISSPSIDWFLIEPSGFTVEVSISLSVACSLSPGIESTSNAGLRLEDWMDCLSSADEDIALRLSSISSDSSHSTNSSADFSKAIKESSMLVSSS